MPDRPPVLPLEATRMYAAGTEAGRLSDGHNELEQMRVQELMIRHLPNAPAVICDVGGGTGPHALWLAKHGYTVHLLDAMPLHIEQALVLDRQDTLASAVVGDARQLPSPDGSADTALLFGTLYHLTEQTDRLQAEGPAGPALRRGAAGHERQPLRLDLRRVVASIRSKPNEKSDPQVALISLR